MSYPLPPLLPVQSRGWTSDDDPNRPALIVKNTFLEVDESVDEDTPSLRRSQSWSPGTHSMSTPFENSPSFYAEIETCSSRTSTTASVTYETSEPQEKSCTEEDSNDVPEAHAEGKCVPCKFFRSSVGCKKGDDCVFCHLPHAKRSRDRPKKATRDLYKRMKASLAKQELDPETRQKLEQEISQESRYFSMLIKHDAVSTKPALSAARFMTC
eukprot:TRINITY_DN115162_c0_g1_i1.p1 TRINITY_DN115162_c0_g1~~TRINITY_DN115162_c0_g1_i1.p1  ORF type:complete len:212 (+),score=45.00 TRINITY_DN115162_c0_g1_i1:86-721(+)